MQNISGLIVMEQRRRVRVGVCAMDKKSKSAPMRQIADRLEAYGEFEILVFGNDVILRTPAKEWPKVDCLIAFFSSGFPLDAALEYVEIHAPFCLNDLEMQRRLLDRWQVYQKLREKGIPTPKNIRISRPIDESSIKEYPEFVDFQGELVKKPFVEKPISGEDHNIHILYPQSQGGGLRKLFRKVNNVSSRYFSEENAIRRDGDYIYEDFIASERDIKVYTVGTNYFYAEGRKAPTVDGIVERNVYGKEIRKVVMLSDEEKNIAAKVVNAFKQTVCGFDLVREFVTADNGDLVQKSYVIDVNGWSFVKGNSLYYDNCAKILRKMFLKSPNAKKARLTEHAGVDVGGSHSDKFLDVESGYELLGVVGVFRHSDRTPKQKIKFKTKSPEICKFFEGMTYPFKEIKLKKNFETLINIAESLLTEKKEGSNWQNVLDILLLNPNGLKIQFKPNDKYDASSGSPPSDLPTSVKVVVKWGGEITKSGELQSRTFGAEFREEVFRFSNSAQVDLFLNDVQVFSSDEDRVKCTAENFVDGLLYPNGSRKSSAKSPIPMQNHYTQTLLDDTSAAKDDVQVAKDFIQELFKETEEDKKFKDQHSFQEFDHLLEHDYLGHLEKLFTLMKRFHERIVNEIKSIGNAATVELRLMANRWEKLVEDFFNEEHQIFDTSKVPDVYDCVKYEAIHSIDICGDSKKFSDEFLSPLYDLSKRLADIVIPLEYGIDSKQKLVIGEKICIRLFRSIIDNLELSSSLDADVKSRCFLYFTSESHINALRNLIVLSGIPVNGTVAKNLQSMELNYLSHCVFQVLKKPESSDPNDCFVRILFSPGAVESPLHSVDRSAKVPVVPVSAMAAIAPHVSLENLRKISAEKSL